MIPKKMQPFFKTVDQTTCGENNLIEGILTCCNTHEFEVFVKGEVKHGFLSKLYLSSKDDDIMLEAHCKKCGKIILVFDSKSDGYEKQFKSRTEPVLEKWPLNCKKCKNSSFSISLKYEYPDIHELEELNLTDIYNAFTWIWITLECNNCRTIYKNFIDYET